MELFDDNWPDSVDRADATLSDCDGGDAGTEVGPEETCARDEIPKAEDGAPEVRTDEI